MADWISWEEAVEVVARHFPIERAGWLLHHAIRRADAVKVWAADDGGVYLKEAPGPKYFDAAPDQPAGPDGRALYRCVNFVDPQSLKLWLNVLTSDAEPSATPAPSSTAKARRGGVPKADWEKYEEAFAKKLAEDGYPDETNVNGWQRQADVVRWLESLVEKDIGYDKVSESTLARHAKTFMNKHRHDP